VTTQNQFFAIPPDDPRAVALYDLIGLQGVIIVQQNVEATLVKAGGDRTSYDQLEAAMGIVNKKIEALLREYRLEQGGDETCRVGLTYDARGFPVVNGRAGAPLLN
jgi:hypothetical protein